MKQKKQDLLAVFSHNNTCHYKSYLMILKQEVIIEYFTLYLIYVTSSLNTSIVIAYKTRLIAL